MPKGSGSRFARKYLKLAEKTAGITGRAPPTHFNTLATPAPTISYMRYIFNGVNNIPKSAPRPSNEKVVP